MSINNNSAEVAATGISTALLLLIRRELMLAARQKGEWVNPLFFFVMVVSLFPLGIGPQKDALVVMAPGVLWIAALLSTLIAAEGMFRPDFDEGALDQLLVSPQPLYLLVIAKVLSHWVFTGLPLTLLAPVLGAMLYLQGPALWALVGALALGTPILCFISGIGAALTVGLRRGGVLLSLIAIPFYIPVLIFGTLAVQAAVTGLSYSGQFAALGAMLALAVCLAPFAIAGALRISASQ